MADNKCTYETGVWYSAVAVWDIALSKEEREALALGEDVRPEHRVYVVNHDTGEETICP